MDEFEKYLLLVAMGISAVLYFVLAIYKKYAYYWWAIGGVVICLPIAMVFDRIQKILNNNDLSLTKTTIFITIYVVIYIGLWIFTKRSEISEEERNRREKLDEAIFDGFLALKEKRLKDAYYIFKKGYLVDPDNPVIKSILSSFSEGQHGLIKKNSFFEWRYKLLLRLKGKKVTPSPTNQSVDKGSPSVEKKIEGRVIE